MISKFPSPLFVCIALRGSWAACVSPPVMFPFVPSSSGKTNLIIVYRAAGSATSTKTLSTLEVHEE